MPTLTLTQEAIYKALRAFPKGLPDHALVPYVQHALTKRVSSSGIRSRRAELCAMGMVEDTGRSVVTGSGRKAAVYKAVK